MAGNTSWRMRDDLVISRLVKQRDVRKRNVPPTRFASVSMFGHPISPTGPRSCGPCWGRCGTADVCSSGGRVAPFCKARTCWAAGRKEQIANASEQYNIRTEVRPHADSVERTRYHTRLIGSMTVTVLVSLGTGGIWGLEPADTCVSVLAVFHYVDPSSSDRCYHHLAQQHKPSHSPVDSVRIIYAV